MAPGFEGCWGLRYKREQLSDLSLVRIGVCSQPVQTGGMDTAGILPASATAVPEERGLCWGGPGVSGGIG